jgi:predicted phage terminase large subunit-like protein
MASATIPDMTGWPDEKIIEATFLIEQIQRFSVMSKEEEERHAYRARLEASPAEFFREAWKVLEPGKPLNWDWHYDCIGEHLHAAFLGQIRRLAINIPPRMGKSSYATIAWPAWGWTRDSTKRFLTSSYSADLSRDHSIKRRRLIQSPWYQSIWPMEMSRDTDRQDQYSNLSTGEMIATSVGATATGRGGSILILDDALSADEAKSKVKRVTMHGWFVDTFSKRLDDPAKGVIVAIEQRTHQEDFTGWAMANEPEQWTLLKIPLVAERPQQYSFPMSGQVITREAGDVLQPDRFPPSVIAQRRIHTRNFATQDQQEPAPDSGIVFMREWWKYRSAPRARYDRVITSWDFAVEGKSTSDYNVGVCLGQVGAEIDIIDVFRAKIPFPQQQRALQAFAQKHPEASKHLVEKKANGPAIVASLATVVSGLVAIEPQGSKEMRADAASGTVEAGNVYLVEGAWNNDWVDEHTIFPNGINDDQCDAAAQGINYLRGKNYAYGLLAAEEEAVAEIQRQKEAYMQRIQMGKPDTPKEAIHCPACAKVTVTMIGGSYHCNSCNHTWPGPGAGKPGSNPTAYLRK